jgi:two-component system sensor histidine kinase CpxA
LLDRALGNVIRNAARYAPEGDIVVRAERHGDEARIVVEDEGPGVPEESLGRLFEPFYRVEPSRDREAGGQGLGLTLVKAAVEAMGGTVWAERRRPRGLAICLHLPAAPEK